MRNLKKKFLAGGLAVAMLLGGGASVLPAETADAATGQRCQTVWFYERVWSGGHIRAGRLVCYPANVR